MNLEDEFYKYLYEEFDLKTKGRPDEDDMLAFARHFAEWQRKQDEEWLNSELMKAHLNGVAASDTITKETLRTEYEKGRYDMREEMMKDAVDGEVIEVLDDDCSICGHAHLELFFDKYTLLENFKDGDKVKVIIVKED